ncbi:MAG: hypothetical protein AAFN92_19720 [Bacteroidota bacterium]
MSSEKNQDRIDDFLLSRSSAQARREFEEEVSRNADLSNELADTELALAAIELAEDRALKARLQELEAGLSGAGISTQAPEREAKVVRMQPKARSNRRWYAIAATLLLLLAVGWWALQPAGLDGRQLALAEFEPYTNIAYTIDRGNNAADPEKAAYVAYEDGDFANAATAFRDLDPTPVRRFYFGQSLLAIEEFAEAEPIFAKLTATDDFQLAAESAYYQALAQVGQGKTEPAKVILEKIVADIDHPSGAEAKSLLEKL